MRSLNYGNAVKAQKQNQKRQMRIYPKGFDMTLADVISEFNLNEDQIKQLGEATVNRKIASAMTGRNVFYRKSTIVGMFGEAPKVSPMDMRPHA